VTEPDKTLDENAGPFKAMLLDERGVLRGVVELADELALTPLHVDLRPHGGDCDRKPGEYRWDAESEQLRPLPRRQRAVHGRPTLEHAFAFHLLKLAADVPDVATSEAVELQWLDDMVRSVDFSPYLALPLVKQYLAARGLDPKKGA